MASQHIRAIIVIISLFGGYASAAEPISPKVDSAIVRGLEYLSLQQKPSGAFDDQGPKVAISALSLMAFMASGHVPNDGRYGQTLRRGLDYLVESFPEDGYVGKVDNSRMYGQGIITLAIAEAYGIEPDPIRQAKMKKVLVRSVEVILKSQQVKKDDNHAGGWRYEPGSPDSDLSLSGWNALALRSCNNIGISVEREVIDRAAKYVLRCYNKDQKAFAYQPQSQASPGMTGVGILNLCLMDRMDAPEVQAASAYLSAAKLNDDTRFTYYSFYYVTHAAYQLGDPIWPPLWKMSSDFLVSRQQADGGWPKSRSGEEPGRTYATAMAILTLSTPNGLLPVHQR